MEEFEFQNTGSPERIDKFLTSFLPDLSRSHIQKLVKDGYVTVNGNTVKPNYKVGTDESVQTKIPEPETLPEIVPEALPLDILYEDADILVVNKPKGMVVHPAPGHYSGTLVNAVMFHCRENLSGINGVLRPGIVHRIDMDTTGSLLICKNDRAHNFLAGQLKEHSITRKYHAIVHGISKRIPERSMLRSADIRPTGKRWRSTRKMESRRSHIIKYWNVFRIIPIWNLN